MLVHPQGCREATSIVEDLGVVVHKSLGDYNQALAEAIMGIASAEGCSVQEAKGKIESAPSCELRCRNNS